VFTQKKETVSDHISYSISLIPNKQTGIRLLGKETPYKEQLKRLKGKPIRYPAALFRVIYQTIQETYQKNNTANKEVSIEITVPQFEKYTLVIDTKKISKESFLNLLQESIVQEDDLETANSMYQKIVSDFYDRVQETVIEDTHVASVFPKPIEINEQPNQLSENVQPSSQNNKNSVDGQSEISDEEPVLDIAGIQEEEKTFESDQPIRIDVEYLKTVDVSKNKISVVDPEYEKEKYNRDARKVNHVINQCVTRLEQDVSAVFKNKSDKLDALSQSQSIQEKNVKISKDDPQALIQIYEAKDQEVDQKKREKIFSLNEELEHEQKELKLNYEKQVQALNETYFKKKNQAINTLDYQFDTWVTTEFQLEWDKHYKALQSQLSTIDDNYLTELATKKDELTNQLQEYLEEVKPAYAEVTKEYLDKRSPELKQEILSDIAIYQKQKEAKQLNQSLTKDEVAKLLEEQEQRLQKSLEVKNEALLQQETNKQAEVESNRRIQFHAFFEKWVTKKVKVGATVFFSVSIFLGLGFSVYQKITYVPPFDTMISSKDYEAAIKNYPNQKYEVVDILYEKVLAGDASALSDLKEVNQEETTVLADFDLAIFNQEYKQALRVFQEGKKEIPMSYWKKRYSVIGYCYLKNGQLEESELYQEKSGDSVLLDKISSYKVLNKQIHALSDQLKQAKEQVTRIDDQKEQKKIKSEIENQEKAVEKLANELKNI